ncbi:MAG: YggS family pyridoxal phosphate-dependent enzyme [Treponema sp.]|nr:MAG: YggS family pyridoxal phosphate-dependent enzyme [Treponema sp.]
MDTIKENLAVIRKRMARACKNAGREVDEVRLLMATKTVEPERILKAFSCGEFLIGENKSQELVEKYEALSPVPHESHFIGHLQSNKIKDVIPRVQCVQSIDRLSLAEKINRRLESEGRVLDILVQVNTSAEESKFGCKPTEALDLVFEISKMPHLNIKGLMTIGLFTDDSEKVRKCFKLLQEVRHDIIDRHFKNVVMDVMSMGMSGDLEVAIEEGSTLIRVGTDIFGKRIYPDSYYWNE